MYYVTQSFPEKARTIASYAFTALLFMQTINIFLCIIVTHYTTKCSYHHIYERLLNLYKATTLIYIHICTFAYNRILQYT